MFFREFIMKTYKFVILNEYDNTYTFVNKKPKDVLVSNGSYFSNVRIHQYRTNMFVGNYRYEKNTEFDTLVCILKNLNSDYRSMLSERKEILANSSSKHTEYRLSVITKSLPGVRARIKFCKSRIDAIKQSKEYMLHLLTK